jgi:puromycin-sensitive aminopeptidase
MPNLKTLRFKGEETIDVKVLEPISEIRLNAKELKISAVSVTNASGTTLNGTVSLDAKTEMATIAFAGTLGAGEWQLNAKFSGILNNKLKGFYRSIWTDKDGGKHTIATTQFESTDARRAFPCFDEPAKKATFKVKLVVPDDLTAISNGRLLSETPVAPGRRSKKPTGLKVCDFRETMKMSTYLNAFIVGEFEHSDPVWVNGKELKVWCTPGKKHLTEAAVEFASRGLAKLEWYLGIPFPGGDKIDFIALPDFASGAMENLAAITFRETAMLINKRTATHAELKRVAEVIIHELVHMWFGDLATMDWWTWLWLNESFATFLENLILSLLEPEWNIFEEFGTSRAAAMRLDSLASTHPIECPVNRPEEVEELFDLISYEKGCSVLYMIHQFIGFENFRQGVNLYLTRHAYGNAEGADFWQALQDACAANGLSVPVVDIMTRWVETAGHPVITVEPADMAGFVKLSQSHFTFLPEAKDASRSWSIPVEVKVKAADGSLSEQKLLLTGGSQTVFVGDNFQHVVVNVDGAGFYRVLYAPALLRKLTGKLKENLSIVERFNLVNDSWSCVRAGINSAPEYLRMVTLFQGETDPNVWSILLGSLSTLNSLLPDESRPALKAIVRDLIKPSMELLGLEPKESDTVQDKQLRGMLFTALGTVGGDAGTQAKADELFAAHAAAVQLDRDMKGVAGKPLEGEMLAAVIAVVAHTGDEADYDTFFKLFKSAGTPQDEQRYLRALSKFQSLDLLKRTLEHALNGEVRSQDAPYLVADVMNNSVASAAAWDFLKKNLAKMLKTYPDNGVVRMLGAISSLDNPQHLAEVQKFFAKRKPRGSAMAIAQAIEQLRVNILLRERESARLSAHLSPSVRPQ